MQSKMSMDGSLAIQYRVARSIYLIIARKHARMGSNYKTNLKGFAKDTTRTRYISNKGVY